MCLVSIIIPHYNSIQLLRKLLKSIPCSDVIEIIVIDDKSDREKEQWDKLIVEDQFKHVLFLSNSTNIKSAGTCRNIGIKYAKGKWLLFADADDYFLNGFYDIIEKYLNLDYEVVFFTPTSIILDTNQLGDRHIQYSNIITNFLNDNNLKSELLLKYNFHSPCSKLIKKDFIKKYKIVFDEVIASNDVMFSTKVGYHLENFFVSTKEIYCITRGIGSLTVNFRKDIYFARLNVFFKQFNYLKKKLSIIELNELDFNGRMFIINAFLYKLSIKEIAHVLLKLKKNKLLKLNLTPLEIIKKIKPFIMRQIRNKKFIVRN